MPHQFRTHPGKIFSADFPRAQLRADLRGRRAQHDLERAVDDLRRASAGATMEVRNRTERTRQRDRASFTKIGFVADRDIAFLVGEFNRPALSAVSIIIATSIPTGP
jgi:hypothetical protein